VLFLADLIRYVWPAVGDVTIEKTAVLRWLQTQRDVILSDNLTVKGRCVLAVAVLWTPPASSLHKT
jgi:hypothetical protein